MAKNKQVALAIQGGGVRGAFSSGVIDVFIEEGIYFPYILGVSSGVLNACNYVSKDIKRSYIVCTKYMNDERFFGKKARKSSGSFFNFEFLMNDLNRELHFSDDVFDHSKQEIVAIATNLDSGEYEPFYKSQMGAERFLKEACVASASLPLLSKKIVIDGKEYLDGGIKTPLPVEQVFNDGYDKVVIILSRPLGKRKEKNLRDKLIAKSPLFYGKKYQNIRKAIREEYLSYNRELNYIESLPKDIAYIIAPKTTYDVKVTEKDISKIEKLYLDGRNYALEHLEEIKKFINE